jgi:hypothetical protein
MKTLALVLSVLVSFSTNAQDIDKLQPCMEIKKACEAAGYQSGLSRGKMKEGKGLVKDCMSKVTNGEAVSGVKVGADVISGCKEKHEK